MKQIGLLIVVVILMVAVGIACIEPDTPIDLADGVEPSGDFSVLFIAEDTDFKNEMIAEATASLKEAKGLVFLVPAKEIESIDDIGFDAVIVVWHMAAEKIPNKVIRYLERAANPDRVILYVTSGGSELSMDYGVDTVTAVSKTADSQDEAEKLVDLILTQCGIE